VTSRRSLGDPQIRARHLGIEQPEEVSEEVFLRMQIENSNLILSLCLCFMNVTEIKDDPCVRRYGMEHWKQVGVV